MIWDRSNDETYKTISLLEKEVSLLRAKVDTLERKLDQETTVRRWYYTTDPFDRGHHSISVRDAVGQLLDKLGQKITVKRATKEQVLLEDIE